MLSIQRVLIAIVITFALAASTGAHALEKIKVTVPGITLTFYPLLVGVDQGMFAKQGFDVEVTQTGGDGPDVDALIAGSVEFTVSTPNRLFTAYEQGKPLLAVANLGNRMALECMLNKEVATKLNISLNTPLEQRIKALKGHVLAGTRVGAFSYLILVGYAKRFGLDPQKDFKLVGIGGPAAQLPAVENNQVSVACIGSPTPELAVSRGKTVMLTNNLAGLDPEYDNFLFEVLYARPDFAKNNPDVVRRMIQGFVEAIAFIHDAPDAEQMPILKKYFSGAPDDILLQAMKNMRPIFKRDVHITEEAVNKAARFMVQTGVVTKTPPWTSVSTNEFVPK
jgi:NitT/TauT family transport system substrate-binding protein